MTVKNNGLSKWTWTCPTILKNGKKCSGEGKKPMSKFQAGRSGRQHLKRVHGDFDSEPDLVRVQ